MIQQINLATKLNYETARNALRLLFFLPLKGWEWVKLQYAVLLI